MNGVKMVALALIVAGAMALAYGSFSYTRETNAATIGPLKLSIAEEQTVNVPVWAGIGALVIGGALLVFGTRKT